MKNYLDKKQIPKFEGSGIGDFFAFLLGVFLWIFLVFIFLILLFAKILSKNIGVISGKLFKKNLELPIWICTLLTIFFFPLSLFLVLIGEVLKRSH